MQIGSRFIIEDRTFKVTYLHHRAPNERTKIFGVTDRPRTVGRVRVLCDGVLMEASIVLSTPRPDLALLTLHWFKTWPTSLQPSPREEDAIVKEWIAQEKFYRWQHETCNHHE